MLLTVRAASMPGYPRTRMGASGRNRVNDAPSGPVKLNRGSQVRPAGSEASWQVNIKFHPLGTGCCDRMAFGQESPGMLAWDSYSFQGLAGWPDRVRGSMDQAGQPRGRPAG